MPAYTPYTINHINLSVPHGSLALADEFYGTTIGFSADPVPQKQVHELRWFRVGDGPQQVHVSFASPKEATLNAADLTASRRHPCFSLATPEALLELQTRIWAHHRAGGPAAPLQCDEPGHENSGSKGVEYPTRFFARDYAGNRLEFNVA